MRLACKYAYMQAIGLGFLAKERESLKQTVISCTHLDCSCIPNKRSCHIRTLVNQLPMLLSKEQRTTDFEFQQHILTSHCWSHIHTRIHIIHTSTYIKRLTTKEYCLVHIAYLVSRVSADSDPPARIFNWVSFIKIVFHGNTSTLEAQINDQGTENLISYQPSWRLSFCCKLAYHKIASISLTAGYHAHWWIAGSHTYP